MTDLIVFVDLTTQASEGIRGFAEVTEDGRHFIEMIEVDGTCECGASDAYRLLKTTHTINLCKDCLRDRPDHIAFEEDKHPVTGEAL